MIGVQAPNMPVRTRRTIAYLSGINVLTVYVVNVWLVVLQQAWQSSRKPPRDHAPAMVMLLT